MYDVNRYNRISIPLYSEKKRKFVLEDAEQDEKETSFMAKIAARLGSSKTNDDEITIKYDLLKEAFIKHFYIPLLEKSKNGSTSENP